MKVININSLSAYNLLKNNKSSCLIDVRTKEEQRQKGVPEIDNPTYFIPWRSAPDMKINPAFEKEFFDHMQNIEQISEIFFICQSGGRSYEAADYITKFGPVNCYNIVDGFEGGTWGAGWKQNNLPWQQLA